MPPVFACFPVLTFFAALGLLAVVIVLIGAYDRTQSPETGPKAKPEWTWQWAAAIVITIVIPLLMLMLIWLSPDW